MSNGIKSVPNFDKAIECLPGQEKWEIKYGCLDIRKGNKYPHWNFSKIKMELELKCREPN
jgi:hypothetical protein